jgi:Cu-Zn family superoxide dismutase
MARGLLILGAVAVALFGCAPAMEREPLSAGATLRNKDGQQVGLATLIETPEGVRIAVSGHRLPAGEKGVHIHETGVCQPPDFTSAGGHFNPHGKKHGLQSPQGPHAGDLPNLRVSPAGQGGIDYVNRLVTLGPGPASLLKPTGTAIVIHAAADDGRTDPTGGSGARIACGVITR